LLDASRERFHRETDLASHLYLTTRDPALKEETCAVMDEMIDSNFSRDEEIIGHFHSALYLSGFGGKLVPQRLGDRGVMYEFNVPQQHVAPYEAIEMLAAGRLVTEKNTQTEGSILTVNGRAMLSRLNERFGKSKFQRMQEETPAAVFSPRTASPRMMS
jgi:hypothetical protein